MKSNFTNSKTSFYTAEELIGLGLKRYGKGVLISRKSSLYNTVNIEIGDNVRIDDFCLLSGNIKLGSNIHISSYSALYGQESIEIEDYSGLSPRCTIFSAMDDFSGNFLIGPMIASEFTNVSGGKVSIKRHVQVGAGSIVFPNIEISEGTVVGAMSLVNKSLPSWGIYAGVPAKFIKKRNQKLLHHINC